MINYVHGDLFDVEQAIKEPLVIAHIVNNKGAFGAGFVIPLGRKYPAVKTAYKSWYDYDSYGLTEVDKKILYEDDFSLGATQVVEVVLNKRYVANMVAQELGGDRPLYYNHLCTCMDSLAEWVLKYKKVKSILAPQFGSGLAGGNWNIIKQLIFDCWCRVSIDITIVRYQ
jgi:hypothetical protein